MVLGLSHCIDEYGHPIQTELPLSLNKALSHNQDNVGACSVITGLLNIFTERKESMRNMFHYRLKANCFHLKCH